MASVLPALVFSFIPISASNPRGRGFKLKRTGQPGFLKIVWDHLAQLIYIISKMSPLKFLGLKKLILKWFAKKINMRLTGIKSHQKAQSFYNQALLPLVKLKFINRKAMKGV